MHYNDKQARQDRHDIDQASRRTDAQNRELIRIVQEHGESGMWGYDDLPPEGGDLQLSKVGRAKGWVIRPDGTSEERVL